MKIYARFHIYFDSIEIFMALRWLTWFLQCFDARIKPLLWFSSSEWSLAVAWPTDETKSIPKAQSTISVQKASFVSFDPLANWETIQITVFSNWICDDQQASSIEWMQRQPPIYLNSGICQIVGFSTRFISSERQWVRHLHARRLITSSISLIREK